MALATLVADAAPTPHPRSVAFPSGTPGRLVTAKPPLLTLQTCLQFVSSIAYAFPGTDDIVAVTRFRIPLKPTNRAKKALLKHNRPLHLSTPHRIAAWLTVGCQIAADLALPGIF